MRYDRAWSWSPAEGNGTTDTSRFNAAPIQFERTASVDAYQRHLAPRRCGLRRLRQRQDGDQVQLRPLPRAGDQRRPVHAEQPGEPHRHQRLAQLARWQRQLRRRLRHPQSGGADHAGGDTCGALTGDALNFGKAGSNLTQVNPDILRGWGVRRYDWQWGVDVQQELIPRVSLDVSYNRRWFGNFTVTDDQARGPADYEPWTITAPVDAQAPGRRRLPDHGLHADRRGVGARGAELRDV